MLSMLTRRVLRESCVVLHHLNRIACLGLVSVMAAACASEQQKIEAASSSVSLVDDQFRPFREYSTGFIDGATASGLDSKRLIARVDRTTGALATSLEFIVTYKGRLKYTYDTARNSKAEPLKVGVIAHKASSCKRSESTCIYMEVVGVAIPEADLRNAPAEGYPVKLFAHLGPDALIPIPKQLIVSLLAKVDGAKTAAVALPSAPPAPVPVASTTQ